MMRSILSLLLTLFVCLLPLLTAGCESVGRADVIALQQELRASRDAAKNLYSTQTSAPTGLPSEIGEFAKAGSDAFQNQITLDKADLIVTGAGQDPRWGVRRYQMEEISTGLFGVNVELHTKSEGRGTGLPTPAVQQMSPALSHATPDQALDAFTINQRGGAPGPFSPAQEFAQWQQFFLDRGWTPPASGNTGDNN